MRSAVTSRRWTGRRDRCDDRAHANPRSHHHIPPRQESALRALYAAAGGRAVEGVQPGHARSRSLVSGDAPPRPMVALGQGLLRRPRDRDHRRDGGAAPPLLPYPPGGAVAVGHDLRRVAAPPRRADAPPDRRDVRDVRLPPRGSPRSCSASCSIPVVVQAIGSDVNVVAKLAGPRRQLGWALPRAAGFVAVSQPLAEAAVELGARPDTVHVIPTGLDRTLFRPRDRAAARAPTRRAGRRQAHPVRGPARGGQGHPRAARGLRAALRGRSARAPRHHRRRSGPRSL